MDACSQKQSPLTPSCSEIEMTEKMAAEMLVSLSDIAAKEILAKVNLGSFYDGDSSARLQSETKKVCRGDQEEKDESQIPSEPRETAPALAKKNGSVRTDNLGFRVPKRLRNSKRSTMSSVKSFKRRRLDKSQSSSELPKMRHFQLQLQLGSEPQAEMPQVFRDSIRRMKGTDVMLILEKTITKSYLRKRPNRLSIPRGKVKADFLTSKEHARLDAKEGITVLLLQHCLEITTLELKKWYMGKTFVYNLVGGWHKQVVDNHANQLEIDCSVQLWSFRIDGELCFALVKI